MENIVYLVGRPMLSVGMNATYNVESPIASGDTHGSFGVDMIEWPDFACIPWGADVLATTGWLLAALVHLEVRSSWQVSPEGRKFGMGWTISIITESVNVEAKGKLPKLAGTLLVPTLGSLYRDRRLK